MPTYFTKFTTVRTTTSLSSCTPACRSKLRTTAVCNHHSRTVVTTALSQKAVRKAKLRANTFHPSLVRMMTWRPVPTNQSLLFSSSPRAQHQAAGQTSLVRANLFVFFKALLIRVRTKSLVIYQICLERGN